MIFRLLIVVTVALCFYWLYLAIYETGRGEVGASRPIAHRFDVADCCLIPANRGLHRGQQ